MWKSSANRYGRIAILIHWLSALLIIGLMIAGFRAAGMGDGPDKVALLQLHAPIGMAVLVLTLLRVGWWLFADRKPAEPSGTPALQARTAQAVHLLFYAAILGMAASGIALMVLSGAGEVLFAATPGPLPEFWDFAPRYGHRALAVMLAGLLVLHVGAALYHQFVLKDRLLARMGVGK